MTHKKKLAIVTGGSSGIGKSIAEKLARQYLVINADIQKPDEQAEGIIHENCNIIRSEDIDTLSRLVYEKGVPEVLVLNAGRGVHEKLREGDPEKWCEVVNLNICGTLRVLRAILPFMNSGHVIFISSVSAGKPHTYGGVYAATKSAVNTIAETLRLEEQPRIDVSVISAGIVDTAFFSNMISGGHDPEEIGWGMVDPNEVADAVSFILKQKSGTAINHITIRPSGQVL